MLVFCVLISVCTITHSICLYGQCVSTYGTELLALVSHLFPYRPALRSKVISEVDGVDGRASLLVQSGLLADPVEDVPVQRAVVIQECLQSQKEECNKDQRNYREEGIGPSTCTCKPTNVQAVAKNNFV